MNAFIKVTALLLVGTLAAGSSFAGQMIRTPCGRLIPVASHRTVQPNILRSAPHVSHRPVMRPVNRVTHVSRVVIRPVVRQPVVHRPTIHRPLVYHRPTTHTTLVRPSTPRPTTHVSTIRTVHQPTTHRTVTKLVPVHQHTVTKAPACNHRTSITVRVPVTRISVTNIHVTHKKVIHLSQKTHTPARPPVHTCNQPQHGQPGKIEASGKVCHVAHNPTTGSRHGR